LARAVVVSTLAATLAVASPGVSGAATTTTISFDDLAVGTKVSTQYDTQGLEFATGIVGLNVYCYPVVTAVSAGQAESGDQVADTSCANGEFPDSSIRGILKSSAQNVSVYAGFSPTWASPPASTTVTLDAYDIQGDVVKTATATVPSGQGTHTLLAVSSSTPNIVGFDVTSSYEGVSVDDLTFDNPSGVPADFAVSAQNGLIYLAQGSTASDAVNIQRFNGSLGAVTFSATGLPTGVSASFSPNPATANTTTVTLSAAPSAAPFTSGTYPFMTITGTPADASGGPAARSTMVQVDVRPLFSVSSPTTLSVPPCSTLKVPVTVSAASGFTGTVALTANGVPADDQVSFNPSTLSLPAQTQSTLTLTSQSDVSGPAGNVSVTATAAGVADSSSAFAVSRVAPSITSLTDSGATPLQGGETPQGASPDLGTVVVVHGQGFCPGSKVYFGNALAVAQANGPAPDGLGPYGDETVLLTSVPSLATSGDVYVVRQGDTLSSPGTAKAAFSVDSYRDINGFSFNNGQDFQNRVGGYSFSDVSDVFGYEQTHVSVNPCWPFGDCSVTTPVPDPFALVFWGIANAALQAGQCFGFSLASQRLLHGDQIYPAFPSQAGTSDETVWDLAGPDAPDGSSGASASLAHFVHLVHMEQFSAQALGYWLAKATLNAVSGSQASLMGDVTSALNAGDHPLIEIRNGTDGHVMVAYGVDQANGNPLVGPGDRVIDVYDPNEQFTAAENATDGVAHQATLATSEIIVHADGHWEFAGFSPEWHGGPGSLVVVPYGVVPVQPSLPINVSGLVSLLFGSAKATQVTSSDGHKLLNPDGSVDTNPATGIPDATQFATLSGTAKPGPDIFLFGHAGTYTTTVQGNATGQYQDTVFAHGMAASLTAAATPAVKDQISVPANLDGLSFGQTNGATTKGGRAATVQLVVAGAQGSERTATLSTTVPTKGQVGAMFNATHDAVEVTAGNQPTSYTLTLSWVGPHGLPQTFAAPTVQLDAGDKATLAPANWSSLESTKVMLSTVHADGKTTTRALANKVRPAAKYTVALKIAKAGTTRQLTINARFTQLAAGSSAVMAWEVFKGRTLAAEQTITLTGTKLHRGLISKTFRFKAKGSARYTFQASVEVLSPTHGAYVSQQVTHTQPFAG
jgi:hypothetical protein